MGFSYAKAKLNIFNALSSFFPKKNVAFGAANNSRFVPNSSTILGSNFSRFSVVPAVGLLGVGGVQRNIHQTCRFLHVTRRFYQARTASNSLNWSMHVQRLMRFCRRTWVALLFGGSVVCTTICCARIQRVPYTGRFHLALTENIEDKLGEYQWQEFEKENKGKLLPLSDPRTIRVQSVATKIIAAMNSGLRLGNEFKINGHLGASRDFGDRVEQYFGFKDALAEAGFKHSQKRDQNFIWKPATKHLNQRNWEVYVLNTPEVNASCHLGGRIVVCNGLLDVVDNDAELATIIGHEVGHAVARHVAEGIVRLFLMLSALIALIYALTTHGDSTSKGNVDGLAKLRDMFTNFMSRRREAEADYIGLMLMASAGYNPQVAPIVYERKLGGEGGIQSTHPSGIKRAKLLQKPKVMNNALAVYEEVKGGEGVRSFV